MKEVRSTWSRERGESHPRLAESPGSRSSPSNPARSDSSHRAHLVGKGYGAAARRDRPTLDQPPDSNRVIEPVKDRR
jgi:hypothetical protein